MKSINLSIHNRLINFNSAFQVVIHQYTETSKVSDVSGDCDINNFNEGILLRSEEISEQKSETYEFFSNKTRCLQSILGIQSDNIWGSITNKVVKQYQRDHGLVVDGLGGYNTLKNMALL